MTMRQSVIIGLALSLAACSPPDKPILPGKLDLKVAQGDRWKLCADDGLEDTTPDADCVLALEVDPMKGYAAALEAQGWMRVEALADGGEVWAKAPNAAGQCERLDVSGVRERFAAKIYTLLRFAVSTGTCG